MEDLTLTELDNLERIAKAALPNKWAEHQKWYDKAGYNNAGTPTRFFAIPGHNGGKEVEMLAETSEHLVAFQPEVALRLIAAARTRQEALAKAWDDGLDFSGDALRAGCSLTEAANGNPFRKKRATETDPDRAGGKPVLVGTRFTVAQLLAELADGRAIKVIADDYDLPLDLCEAAVREVASRL